MEELQVLMWLQRRWNDVKYSLENANGLNDLLPSMATVYLPWLYAAKLQQQLPVISG